MKCLIIIPARLKSSRLHEKLLKKINGKEIIAWTAERVKLTNLEFVVAIDDSKFINVLEKFEFPWVMTSIAHHSGTSRAGEVSELYPDYDYFCIVQGDEPLVDPKTISEFIHTGMKLEEDYVQAITRFGTGEDPEDLTNVKAVISITGKMIYASRSMIPLNYNSSDATLKTSDLFQISGLYLFKKPFFKKFKELPLGYLEKSEKIEQLSCIFNELPIQTLEIFEPMMSIDSKEDFDRITENWEELNDVY
jgi:3-deoxy-manno-octulosonate cytidylyltransferase (CMP-KDO synthetase)